ncbi:MAG TPA: hypothetical protein VMV16_01365 [Solirubrobacteraceae bacterium]|nr:hypothetical protein [Solirubrobacteraceae bacterium]
MKSVRFAAAIAATGVALAVPAGASASGATSTSASQITPSAPARLSTTKTVQAPATTTKTMQASATTSTAQSGTLPNTGLDLLPETVLGVALVGVGVGLRVHHSRG